MEKTKIINNIIEKTKNDKIKCDKKILLDATKFFEKTDINENNLTLFCKYFKKNLSKDYLYYYKPTLAFLIATNKITSLYDDSAFSNCDYFENMTDVLTTYIEYSSCDDISNAIIKCHNEINYINCFSRLFGFKIYFYNNLIFTCKIT